MLYLLLLLQVPGRRGDFKLCEREGNQSEALANQLIPVGSFQVRGKKAFVQRGAKTIFFSLLDLYEHLLYSFSAFLLLFILRFLV